MCNAEMHSNNAINADSHEQGSFVALLMAAGYGERSAGKTSEEIV